MLYQDKNSVGNYRFQCLKYINFRYTSHLHKHIEVVYVESGALEVVCGKTTEIMRAGDFALIPPNMVHSYSPIDANVCYVCVFSVDLVAKFYKELSRGVGGKSVFHCDDITENYVLQKLLKNKDCDLFTVKSALYAICACYLKEVPITENRISDNILLHNVLSYISDNYTKDITLAGMAKDLGYEQHYLSRYLHNNLNMSFKSIVNSNRVDKAKQLLNDSNLPMTEIARLSGFQSVRSFNRVFKEFTGVQPGRL